MTITETPEAARLTTERVLDAVDLLTHIASGPMADRLVNQQERVALLTLETAAFRGEDDLTMSELGKRIGLSRAAVTALTDRLTKRGLVKRQADIEDRRRTFLVITDAGRALVDEALSFDPQDADR